MTKTAVSRNEPKAKGLNFQFKYPSSFEDYPTQRPNIVKSVGLSKEGIFFSVGVLKLDFFPTLEEKKYNFSETGIIQDVSEKMPDAEVYNVKSGFKLEGEYACRFNSKVIHDRMGNEFEIYSRTYRVVYQDYLIEMTGSVINHSMQENKKIENYEMIFDLMVNSFVLISKWE